MSILRSKNASSLEVIVSHVKQRVSFVKIPEKRSCTQLCALSDGWALLYVIEDVPSVFVDEWMEFCEFSAIST